MTNLMKKVTATVLTWLARIVLARRGATIIGITGSVGKTTTKEAIAAVVRTRVPVRVSGGNLNNELGMPLAIIGGYEDDWYERGGTWGFWFGVLGTAFIRAFTGGTKGEVLVLEYGADKPGDIGRLVRAFPPHVAVVTAVGEVPVHVQFYASPRDVAREKMGLVARLGPSGHAVLNYDDLTVLEMREHTKAKVHTFGAGQGSDVQLSGVHTRINGAAPTGVMFNLSRHGHTMPVAIAGVLGDGIAHAAAAAVAVGSIFNVGLAGAVEALIAMHAQPGRMRILEGIKGSTIIDDTYNSSPAAAHLALDTVAPLQGRKVVVLGDMLELGEHEIQAHQAVGNRAATVASELVCVGTRGKIIADAAANQLAPEHIRWYPDATTAASQVQRIIQPGDLVLVKGSQGVRMERIVAAIMADPARAGELLVRQSDRWLAKE